MFHLSALFMFKADAKSRHVMGTHPNLGMAMAQHAAVRFRMHEQIDFRGLQARPLMERASAVGSFLGLIEVGDRLRISLNPNSVLMVTRSQMIGELVERPGADITAMIGDYLSMGAPLNGGEGQMLTGLDRNFDRKASRPIILHCDSEGVLSLRTSWRAKPVFTPCNVDGSYPALAPVAYIQ